MCTNLVAWFLCLMTFVHSSIVILIIDQPVEHHISNADNLIESVTQQSIIQNVDVTFFRVTKDFQDVTGAWVVWPLFTKLLDKISAKNCKWLLVSEDETSINLERLMAVFEKFDTSEDQEWFIGHALRDRQPTIIHHYAFVNDPGKMLYPDFGSGFAMTLSLVQKLAHEIVTNNFQTSFSIDAKHELAMLIWGNGNGTVLTDVKEFCTFSDQHNNCATFYKNSQKSCQNQINADNLQIYVKTCAKFHESRVPIVKNTWAKNYANQVQFYSDEENQQIPTINIGLKNTERGHCGKTFEIIRRFSALNNSSNWLCIVDDDTLISILRLIKLLKCYNNNDSIIIGEKYGYGFSNKGASGYDYPTGGSGMFFSYNAAKSIIDGCYCPSIDSPDDMVLGMCASQMGIKIVHSAALHQARPGDYAEDYLTRIQPISFHKFYEVDPVQVYETYLKDDDLSGNNHEEL